MLWSFPCFFFFFKVILRFFSFFSYKSHGLFPLHISTSILAFCDAVKFPSLCFLSKKIKKKFHFKFFSFFFLFFSLSLFFFILDEFLGFCFGYIQLLFLLFFTGCSYSWIYVNLFHTCLFIFAFLFFLFSLSFLFSPLLHPFLFSFPSLLPFLSPFSSPFFPSLFLLSPSKSNCWALYAIFHSWPSAHAQISRLSIS